jgi:type III secretory pathway component EscU
MYSGLAYFIVLVLVAQFVLSSGHSTRTRLLVAGTYGLIFLAGYLLPQLALAVLLAQVALGIVLIFVYRWEHPKDSLL